MEYDNQPVYQHDAQNPVHRVLENITQRVNDLHCQVAEQQSLLDQLGELPTSEAYADQVIAAIMEQMPVIQERAVTSAMAAVAAEKAHKQRNRATGRR